VGLPCGGDPRRGGAVRRVAAAGQRKGTESRPAWYVHDRLLVRLHDRDTLVIRVPLSEREALLERYPDSFGVPPRMEAHHKVEAYLRQAHPRAIRAAIDLAWEMQRR